MSPSLAQVNVQLLQFNGMFVRIWLTVLRIWVFSPHHLLGSMFSIMNVMEGCRGFVNLSETFSCLFNFGFQIWVLTDFLVCLGFACFVYHHQLRWAIARKVTTAIRTCHLQKKAFSDDAVRVGSSSNHHAENNKGREKFGVTNYGDQCDVAIVGGGMVGMALACALSSMPLTRSLHVTIIDDNPALGVKECMKKDDLLDPRVSTVTPATISLFKDIGAWEYVQRHRHAFFDEMQVWDHTGLGYTRYSARDVGREILGCVVENKVLLRSLLSCLQNTEFLTTIYPAKLSSMVLPSRSVSAAEMVGSRLSNHASTLSGSTAYPDILQQKTRGCLAKLDLSDGNSLYAKLVVGADGGKSRVRDIASFKTTGWNYSQQAIICTVEHATENHCAWQRFLPTGPIALLPIGDRFSNIVWTMSPKESLDRKSMSGDDFVESVNHALDYGYGPLPPSSFLGLHLDGFQVPPKVNKLVTERLAFPLSLRHASHYVSHRVALIGDAAHTVHPLAGQGVNLGFGDAFSLSKVLAEGIHLGADIGEISLLKKYEEERKPANIAMMAILDGFQKAYSVDLGPVNLLRAVAMNTAHYCGPLKRNIISYASGDQKWPLFF